MFMIKIYWKDDARLLYIKLLFSHEIPAPQKLPAPSDVSAQCIQINSKNPEKIQNDELNTISFNNIDVKVKIDNEDTICIITPHFNFSIALKFKINPDIFYQYFDQSIMQFKLKKKVKGYWNNPLSKISNHNNDEDLRFSFQRDWSQFTMDSDQTDEDTDNDGIDGELINEVGLKKNTADKIDRSNHTDEKTVFHSPNDVKNEKSRKKKNLDLINSSDLVIDDDDKNELIDCVSLDKFFENGGKNEESCKDNIITNFFKKKLTKNQQMLILIKLWNCSNIDDRSKFLNHLTNVLLKSEKVSSQIMSFAPYIKGGERSLRDLDESVYSQSKTTYPKDWVIHFSKLSSQMKLEIITSFFEVLDEEKQLTVLTTFF